MHLKELTAQLLTTIIKKLILIHTGSYFIKIKAVFELSLITGVFATLFDYISNWTIDNQLYIFFVFSAIVIDHLLGSIKHAFLLRDFTFKKNIAGLAIKIALAVSIGFLFEGVNHLFSSDNFLKTYIEIVLRLMVFLYPAGSAFMNSAAITNGKFPPIGWINKLNAFNKDLDLNRFREKENLDIDRD